MAARHHLVLEKDVSVAHRPRAEFFKIKKILKCVNEYETKPGLASFTAGLVIRRFYVTYYRDHVNIST